MGYLTYIDVSVGEKVAGYGTGMGRLDVMCHNPSNAVIHLGHPQGIANFDFSFGFKLSCRKVIGLTIRRIKPRHLQIMF